MKTPKRLELVQVPRPCSISWGSMTGTDQARACAVCDRHVYDLSTMTAKEGERLLLEHEGERLCVRVARGDDGRVMTADHPGVYSRRSFAGISLAAVAAFLGLSEVRGALAAAQLTPDATRATRKRDGSLSGIVLDPSGAGFSEATVVAINEQNGEDFTTKPAADGRYRILLPKGIYLVSITCPGFVPFSVGGFRVRSRSTLNRTLHFPCMGECITVIDDNAQPTLVNVLTAPLRAVKRLVNR